MKTVVHGVFGEVEVDPENGLNEWDSETEFAGGMIDLDITFDGATMDRETLDKLATYVTDLAGFDHKAQTAIRANLAEEDSDTRDYLEHHLDEPNLVRNVFGVDDPSTVNTEAFLAALRLIRVGLYAGTEAEECEAAFDYTIGKEETQYLIVVKFDENRTVSEVCMES